MALLEMLLTRFMFVVAMVGPWALIAVWLLTWWIRSRLAPRREAEGAGRPLRVLFGSLGMAQGLAITGLIMTFGPGSGVVRELGTLQDLVGKPLPMVAARAVEDDTTRSLDDFAGQVVVLNIWATWCPPCRKEMPDLQRLQERYRDRGVSVVTVSTESRETLVPYAAENQTATTNLYSDALPTGTAGGVLPTTLLLDRDGIVREFAVGAHSEAFFARWVERYLG